jgi:hypothetical protein
MRLPRPLAVALVTIMMARGFEHPNQLASFADAMSKLPDHIWVIIDGLLASIAGTKAIRDIRG